MNFFNATLAGLLASTLLAGGCASPSGRADLATWQTRLEEHVARIGHGDLNVLRVADPASPVPMFNVLGGAEPEDSIDHAGLLLGKRTAADRTWYFFLVATIEARQINAIRLVAVSARPAFDSGASIPGDDGRARDRGLDWRVDPTDPHTFALYRQSIARFVASPDPLARWTSGVDRFDLAGTGPQWRATHTPSGAVWTVDTAAAAAVSSVAHELSARCFMGRAETEASAVDARRHGVRADVVPVVAHTEARPGTLNRYWVQRRERVQARNRPFSHG